MSTTEVKNKGINGNVLKIIAMVAMVIDHVAIVLVPEDFGGMWFLRFLGRFTAPLLCYIMVEGYYHTSDINKYMQRLLFIAIISHVPHNLCFGFSVVKFWTATSSIWAFLMGLLALRVCKLEKLNVFLKLGAVGLACILAYSADWNFIAVFWIVGLGLTYGNKLKQIIVFALVDVLYIAMGFVIATETPIISKLGVFAVIPLILMYNGTRGKKSKTIQWFFYWFYPLHLLILYLIKLAL